MKRKFLLLLLVASSYSVISRAQDTVKTTPDAPLVLYGSVDTYFKDDFSGHANIPTSFATDQNSVSIGMVDIGLKKTVGNASFVGELSFGPRGQEQSLPNSDGSYHIQNLYVSYNLTPKLTAAAGYMSTFVGYEVISPTGNFNYSTSYLFTAGPFQNAGFKLTYAFNDKVTLMAGIFNNYWNTYTSYRYIGEGTYSGDVSTFGAQLTITPLQNWTAYINVLSGSFSGTIVDLTTAYQITTDFKLGLNAADYNRAHNYDDAEPAPYEGVALYPQLAVSKVVTIGLRGEYFEFKALGLDPSDNVKSITATANIKAGPLTFIPEIRFDDDKGKHFYDSNDMPTSSASQFVLAAVYAF